MPKYIVTNGIKYLRQNQKGDYYLVGKKEATAWSTQKQAQNALNNGIPKNKRSSFHVENPAKQVIPILFLTTFWKQTLAIIISGYHLLGISKSL